MPPAATNTFTSATATLQYLQAAYGPEARSASQAFALFYFSNLTVLQILSVLFSSAFLAATVYVSIKTGWLRTRVERFQDVVLKNDLAKKSIRTSWDDIETHFFAGDDNDLKITILEADKLLDEALRNAGVPGNQLGDRLKNVKPARLPNIEDLWEAHRIRNRIAHETDFVLKRDLAEKALTIYEEALTHLGYLETKKKPTLPTAST